MIEITYRKNLRMVTVKGHANSGNRGEDVVCAGISALVQCLAINVRHLEDKGALMSCHVETNPGDSEISARPYPRYSKSCSLIFDSICAGIELLSRESDGYIIYTVLG